MDCLRNINRMFLGAEMCKFFLCCFRSRHDEERLPLVDRANFNVFYGRPDPLRDFLNYEYKKEKGFETLIHKERRDTEFGWKIHVSLDPAVENVRRAWQDIIIPILIQYNIKEAKVAIPENLSIAAGKVVTIYLVYNRELTPGEAGAQRLQSFLVDIENGLLGAGIRPGDKPEIDVRTQGSQFLSYRCELGPEVADDHRAEDEEPFYKPLTESEAKDAAELRGTSSSNPYEHPDIYGLSGIQININQQPRMSNV